MEYKPFKIRPHKWSDSFKIGCILIWTFIWQSLHSTLHLLFLQSIFIQIKVLPHNFCRPTHWTCYMLCEPYKIHKWQEYYQSHHLPTFRELFLYSWVKLCDEKQILVIQPSSRCGLITVLSCIALSAGISLIDYSHIWSPTVFTEGGHANSFLCTEGSIKTTTLFFFPLWACAWASHQVHAAGSHAQDGGRSFCGTEELKRWAGHDLQVFYEGMRLICLQRSMLLASSHPWVSGRAKQTRAEAAGYKLVHWHADRQSGPWERNTPSPLSSSVGSRWQKALKQALAWKDQPYLSKTPCGHQDMLILKKCTGDVRLLIMK